MWFFERIRAIPRKSLATSQLWRDQDSIVMNYENKGIIARNWGDKLNPYIAGRISGCPVIHRDDVYLLSSRPVHYWIGSNLAKACKDRNAVIWGAGFIRDGEPILGRPMEIRAVRGWLSHARLRMAGIPAPDSVGDIALLLPRLYRPKRHLERRSLGVIPHCREWHEAFFREVRNWRDVRLIDICGEIGNVIEQIIACDRIISSSLHGIICADAYGIPAIWLKVSNKPRGDGFKFRDYFSSVGRPDRYPALAFPNTSRSQIEKNFFDYSLEIDLDALWRACPIPIKTA